MEKEEEEEEDEDENKDREVNSSKCIFEIFMVPDLNWYLQGKNSLFLLSYSLSPSQPQWCTRVYAHLK